MPENATSVVFFVASLYAFAIVLLYVLARAWEQALSTRPATEMDRGAAGNARAALARSSVDQKIKKWS